MSDDKNRVVSWQEGADLLGAEAPEDIGPVQLDPIGMCVIATRIGRRLASKRGRPTDPSWEMTRKIPMKKRTWEHLDQMARALAEQGQDRVSAGQLAAIALEDGLPILLRERSRCATVVTSELDQRFLCFPDETQKEARELCGVIDEKGFF